MQPQLYGRSTLSNCTVRPLYMHMHIHMHMDMRRACERHVCAVCLPAACVRVCACLYIPTSARVTASRATRPCWLTPSRRCIITSSRCSGSKHSACPDGLRAQLVYHPHIAAPHSNVRESNAVPEAVFVDGFDKYPLRRFARECAAAAAR